MGAGWEYCGRDADFDRLGSDLDISNAGLRIVLSASLNMQSTTIIPYTKIFENINGDWVQIGNNITGTADNGGDGNALRNSISGDGSRILIGHGLYASNASGIVRLFEFNGSDYVQLGSDLLGEEFSEFGDDVELSKNGNRFVVGEKSFGFADGRVRVYEYNGSSLVQVGQSLIEGGDVNFFGTEVAINDNGTRIATVASVGPTGGGETKVYELNGNTWQQIGNTLNGEGQGGVTEVDFNGSGQRMAIGNFTGFSRGVCRVYDFVNGIWEQVGTDFVGDEENDSLAASIDLSQSGDIIAITAPGGGELNEGYVRIYKYENNNWEQVEDNILGIPNSFFGADVAINTIGDKIVTSTTIAGITMPGAGRIEVYQNENILAINNSDTNNFLIYPNPATSIVNINGLKNLHVERIALIHVTGRIVFETKESLGTEVRISVKNLTSGLYFVNIQHESGTVFKQLIVE
jgi:hypothetical protein